jgi:hypothetical protein
MESFFEFLNDFRSKKVAVFQGLSLAAKSLAGYLIIVNKSENRFFLCGFKMVFYI